MFGKNWTTTMPGIAAICTALGSIFSHLSAEPATIDWPSIGIVISGIGLIFAKSHNVTGGTVSQPSSTQALVDKAEEKRTPEASAALRGDKSAVSSDAIAPAP